MTEKHQLTPLIQEFCNNIDAKSTREVYARRLYTFQTFLEQKYHTSPDMFVQSFKGSATTKYDVYDILSKYRQSFVGKLQRNTIAGRLMTTRNFLEFNDVPITLTKWRLKVKPPKPKPVDKSHLDTPTVRKIILGCRNARMKAYIHTLAQTGCRPAELLSVLAKHFDSEKGTLHLRAEYTKMRVPRTILLTKEVIDILKKWVDYRNRTRKIIHPKVLDKDGKVVSKRWVEYKQIPLKDNDLLFSTGVHELGGRFFSGESSLLYRTICRDFGKALHEVKLDEKRDLNDRHKITLHSFRSFVKTTISNLGYQDFSEYYIGHKGSTYWTKSEDVIRKMFDKVEPYLTYLDYSTLEAKGADTQTQLEQKDQRINQLEQQYQELNSKLEGVMNLLADVSLGRVNVKEVINE